MRNPVARFIRYFKHRLKSKYGMTPERYEYILLAQHGRCLVCNTFMDIPTPEHRVRHGKSAVIDHDHETGSVRAILCNNCNRAIGLLAHSVDTTRRALAYLMAWEHIRVC